MAVPTRTIAPAPQFPERETQVYNVIEAENPGRGANVNSSPSNTQAGSANSSTRDAFASAYLSARNDVC